MQDGEKVKIHITSPKEANRNPPSLFLYMAVVGFGATIPRIGIGKRFGCGKWRKLAVFPDYTPSPEAHYPVAINQIMQLPNGCRNTGKKSRGWKKISRWSGTVFGGNMTAAVVLMAKNKKGPAIKLQVMLWPVTDANFDDWSYRDLGEGRFLTKKIMIWFWEKLSS